MTLDEFLAKAGIGVSGGRDTTAAAQGLMEASDEWLLKVAKHDPSMIRDVAAALIYERGKH